MPIKAEKPIADFKHRYGLFLGIYGIVIILILISWYYRDDVFQSIYDPGMPFQTYTPPPAPDYNQPQAWLVQPDPKIDPIHISGGDVFVITPTLYLGGQHWNAPTHNAQFLSTLERIAIPNYIIPYTSAGRVYAPNYRQAALYSFLTNRDDATESLKFAYNDIKRAFEIFLSNNPPERPIILIGHGQGGFHVQRLLSEYFQNGLQKKLAAAYIIDHPLPLDRFDKDLVNLHPCQTEQDINCVIAFGAFTPREKTRLKMFSHKALTWDKSNFSAVQSRSLLCINPLSWNFDTSLASANLHLGGVAAEGLGINMLPAPTPQQTQAQCKGGVLIIQVPKQKSLRRPNRFGDRFRTSPSNLFYEDIRVDASRRMQNILKTNTLPKRAPLLDLDTIEINDNAVTPALPVIKD